MAETHRRGSQNKSNKKEQTWNKICTEVSVRVKKIRTKKNAVEPAITTKGADRKRKKGGLPKGNGQIAS